VIRDLDVETLAKQFRSAEPFPHLVVDEFLEPEPAKKVADAYPSFDDATQQGRAFETVNEHLKVQVCDYERFPEPVQQLAELDEALVFLVQFAL
jgi:hypothetical protein